MQGGSSIPQRKKFIARRYEGLSEPVTLEFSKGLLADGPKVPSCGPVTPVPVLSDPKVEEVDVDLEVNRSVDVDDSVDGTLSTGRGGRGASENIELQSAVVE